MAKKKVNKSEAIRKAIDKLGSSASAADIQAEVKKSGVDVTPQLIYNLKGKSGASGIIKKPGRKGKRGRPAASASANGISIGDINSVRDLTNRLGAKTVKQLCDVLG